MSRIGVARAEKGNTSPSCDAEGPDLIVFPPPPPGSYFHTLDWHEAHDGRFQLQLQNVQPPSSGIYSATYLEASPLGSAFFRLIVRGEEQKTEAGWCWGAVSLGIQEGRRATLSPENISLQAVGLDAGGQGVARTAQAACTEVSVMTMMANVCAPRDSLVPAVSRVSRRARS